MTEVKGEDRKGDEVTRLLTPRRVPPLGFWGSATRRLPTVHGDQYIDEVGTTCSHAEPWP